MAKGLRFDEGKNRLDLIPPEWEWALGEVLTAGAKKYADRNWEQGMNWSKVYGPLKRHLLKWLAGETYDMRDLNGKATRCHHLAIVAWNALALMTYELKELGTDDLARFNNVLEKVKNDITLDSSPTASGQSIGQDNPRPRSTGSSETGVGETPTNRRPEGTRDSDVCHCDGGKE
jgi:hypothetical protein|tara:strand:- start:74 stop:598 length:525 start_codon:yes stop_codon:yes gene_type:complete